MDYETLKNTDYAAAFKCCDVPRVLLDATVKVTLATSKVHIKQTQMSEVESQHKCPVFPQCVVVAKEEARKLGRRYVGVFCWYCVPVELFLICRGLIAGSQQSLTITTCIASGSFLKSAVFPAKSLNVCCT